MNYQKKHITWLIVAAFILLVAAACGPATPTPDENADEADAGVPAEVESPAEEASEAEVSPADPDLAAPEAAEPVVLEGAITTDSGLQVLEVVAGDGPTPQEGDLVTMDFSGSLPDGTMFGDSYSSGQPITVVYGSGQLLPGWE